jgi:hypothetical protein
VATTEGYVDDVDAMGDNVNDFTTINNIITNELESMSGQILNHNRKSAVLGLGTWTGRQEGHFLGIQPPPPQAQSFWGDLCPFRHQDIITASLEACLKGVKAAIAFWASRHLATQRPRSSPFP